MKIRIWSGVWALFGRDLRISPVTSISSDRLCAIKLFVSHTDSINIVCVYLPSSDHGFEEFRDCINEMSSVVGALAPSGPVVLLGDFNTYLSVNSYRSELLSEVIQEYNLFSASTSCIAHGPDYTYFSREWKTISFWMHLWHT